MKKKIYVVVLCVLMCVVMCVPVLGASDGYIYIGSPEGMYSILKKPFSIEGMSAMYAYGHSINPDNKYTCEFAVWIPDNSVGYVDNGYYCFFDAEGNNINVHLLQTWSGEYFQDYSADKITIPVDNSVFTWLQTYTFVTKMFDSKEHALAYLSDGSTDGLFADGSTVEYDSSVPAPTEVHIESRYLADEGCPRTTIAFKSSETYESSGMQTEIRYRYSGTFYESGVFGDSKTNRKAFTSPIYKKDLIKTLSVNYVGNTSNNNTVIMNWYDEFMDNDAYKNYAEYKEVEANKHSISWIAAPFNSIEYWIRNVTSDNKASDWVHCKYNYDTGELEETWTDTVPGGRTDVINGNVEPGEETPGDIKDSYEIDSNIKNDGGFDTNSSGLIYSIKDLFSDNGVVGMVKAVFGFMPGWMIAYVSLFFTILIALMILYFVRG